MPTAISAATDASRSTPSPSAMALWSRPSVRSARQTICTSAGSLLGPWSQSATSGSGSGAGEVCTHESRWLGSRTGACAFGANNPRASASPGIASALIPKSMLPSAAFCCSHSQVRPMAAPYTGSSFSESVRATITPRAKPPTTPNLSRRPNRCRSASRLAHSVISPSKSKSAPASIDWVATTTTGASWSLRVRPARMRWSSVPCSSSRSNGRMRPVSRWTATPTRTVCDRCACTSRADLTRLTTTATVAPGRSSIAETCLATSFTNALGGTDTRVAGLEAPSRNASASFRWSESSRRNASPAKRPGVADISTTANGVERWRSAQLW